ncbi:MAG: tripartite tricarboxylate transporter TctB family protein [Thermodesulfobacteriota bacterium]
MPSMDRDFRVGCLVFLFGVTVSWLSLRLPMRGDFIESPGIFPGLMGLLLTLFGAILAGRSYRKGGRLRLGHFVRAIVPFFTSTEHRSVLLGILFPALYIFVGVPLIGFYPSSALFLTVMFYLFVEKWRRRFVFLPVAIGLTVLLYLVFNKLFMLQIR